MVTVLAVLPPLASHPAAVSVSPCYICTPWGTSRGCWPACAWERLRSSGPRLQPPAAAAPLASTGSRYDETHTGWGLAGGPTGFGRPAAALPLLPPPPPPPLLATHINPTRERPHAPPNTSCRTEHHNRQPP